MRSFLALGDFRDFTGNKELWIELAEGAKQRGKGLIVGREFQSLEELEAVARDIRADLDRALQDARIELGG